VVPLSLASDNLILRAAIDALAAVLFPAPCRICATTLLTASRIPICESCLTSFQPIVQPMCECCGRPFPTVAAIAATCAQSGRLFPAMATGGAADVTGVEVAKPLCRLCRNYAFDRARSYGPYHDALHHAILLLK
jgi:Double zinc ribbon domain